MCFSHDWSLLITRQWLLERIGLAVISVMSEEEMRDKLKLISPDVIVLCQTLTSQECEDAVAMADRCSPTSRCVILCPNLNELSHKHKELSAGDMNSPATFLCAVQSLLADGARGQPSYRTNLFAEP